MLEGPRKDKLGQVLRAKGKACRDGATGFFTLKSRDGEFFAEQTAKKYFVCTAAIAMTDARDIKACKVLRKLEVGEVLRVSEGPVKDEDAGVERLHCVTCKDGLDGWVTIKGNAGTVYAEESSKHYAVLRAVPLQKRFPSEGSDVIRVLAQDEAVEVLEAPREERLEASVRVKGRALSDGAEGWVTMRPKQLSAWTPVYRCSGSQALQDGPAAKSAQSIRKLDIGEIVEVLDGPTQDAESGAVRIRGRALKDGLVGWASVKSDTGAVLLTCKLK